MARSGAYNPTILRVGTCSQCTFVSIQAAIDAAATVSQPLLMVHPGVPDSVTNRDGVYFENIIVSFPLRIQGKQNSDHDST